MGWAELILYDQEIRSANNSTEEVTLPITYRAENLNGDAMEVLIEAAEAMKEVAFDLVRLKRDGLHEDDLGSEACTWGCATNPFEDKGYLGWHLNFFNYTNKSLHLAAQETEWIEEGIAHTAIKALQRIEDVAAFFVEDTSTGEESAYQVHVTDLTFIINGPDHGENAFKVIPGTIVCAFDPVTNQFKNFVPKYDVAME